MFSVASVTKTCYMAFVSVMKYVAREIYSTSGFYSAQWRHLDFLIGREIFHLTKIIK